MSIEIEKPVGPKRLSFQTLQRISIFVLLIVLCTIAAFESPTFLTWYNVVNNLFTNSAALGIMAIGMTFVMIGGGFDLSVASTTAVCSVVLVLVLNAMAPHGSTAAICTAIGAAALVGIALGAVNGILIAYVGVNPFVVTLSTMLVFRGLALILTRGGQSLQVADSALRENFQWFYDWEFVLRLSDNTIPVPILIFVAVFLICIYLLRFTRFGYYIYAIGGNEEAAWLAGVNTKRIKAMTYMLCGLSCAIAAIIFLAMTMTAQAEAHAGRELTVIASVIVGGTPLGGGSGGLVLTLAGLLLLQVIENLLTQFNVGDAYRPVVTGLIIVVVVTIDVLVRRKSRK